MYKEKDSLNIGVIQKTVAEFFEKHCSCMYSLVISGKKCIYLNSYIYEPCRDRK